MEIEMEYLFKYDIINWNTWIKIYQSIEVFKPIIKQIFDNEKIFLNKIEHCTPATNAIFKAGSYIIKIYAPKETGMETDGDDYKTEAFGLLRAEKININAPKIIAHGSIQDKYLFRYIIMEEIKGVEFSKIDETLSSDDKILLGRKLRDIFTKLNTECTEFNTVDCKKRSLLNKRWDIMPKTFNDDRIQYIKNINMSQKVYVHGDINPNNILLDCNDNLYVLDFADALLAPIEYEYIAIVCYLFCFDKSFMKGFFGKYENPEFIEKCLLGLLLHDFGANMIQCNLGNVDDIVSLDVLEERLSDVILSGKQHRDSIAYLERMN
jgi:serine/threonine protein kinase